MNLSSVAIKRIASAGMAAMLSKKCRWKRSVKCGRDCQGCQCVFKQRLRLDTARLKIFHCGGGNASENASHSDKEFELKRMLPLTVVNVPIPNISQRNVKLLHRVASACARS